MATILEQGRQEGKTDLEIGLKIGMLMGEYFGRAAIINDLARGLLKGQMSDNDVASITNLLILRN